MKKIIFIAIMATIASISVFTACNKDVQNTIKPAKINPLKNIKEGTTYTFYGQTDKNIANEEICQMQLTMGKNGEWTVKKQVIPNRMFKSSVEISTSVLVNIPEEYIKRIGDNAMEFNFPQDEDIKYYIIPFEVSDKKEASFIECPKGFSPRCECEKLGNKNLELGCSYHETQSGNITKRTCSENSEKSCTSHGQGYQCQEGCYKSVSSLTELNFDRYVIVPATSIAQQ